MCAHGFTWQAAGRVARQSALAPRSGVLCGAPQGAPSGGSRLQAPWHPPHAEHAQSRFESAGVPQKHLRVMWNATRVQALGKRVVGSRRGQSARTAQRALLPRPVDRVCKHDRRNATGTAAHTHRVPTRARDAALYPCCSVSWEGRGGCRHVIYTHALRRALTCLVSRGRCRVNARCFVGLDHRRRGACVGFCLRRLVPVSVVAICHGLCGGQPLFQRADQSRQGAGVGGKSDLPQN